MSDISRLIKLLQNDDHNKRYEACEELRTSQPPLPQEALDALAIAKNDKNPDVADAARRALEFHTTSESIIEKASNTPIDSTDNNKAKNNGGGLIYYYVVLLIIFIFSCPTIFWGAAVQSNSWLSGAAIIFILLLIAPVFFTNKSSEINKSQPSSIDSSPRDEVQITKAEFAKLTYRQKFAVTEYGYLLSPDDAETVGIMLGNFQSKSIPSFCEQRGNKVTHFEQ